MSVPCASATHPERRFDAAVKKISDSAEIQKRAQIEMREYSQVRWAAMKGWGSADDLRARESKLEVLAEELRSSVHSLRAAAFRLEIRFDDDVTKSFRPWIVKVEALVDSYYDAILSSDTEADEALKKPFRLFALDDDLDAFWEAARDWSRNPDKT